MIEVKNLRFSYPDADTHTINGVSLQISQGSFVLLCGPTGCGKTTLLRHIKPELIPVGTRTGQVFYGGTETTESPGLIPPGDIGMVMQHPDSQIVMEDVRQELVFGLENLGLSTRMIRIRMAEMAHYFGFDSWIDQKTDELSDGRKQLLNLASVLVLQPRVLLLDEPTAQLDPIAANQFLQTVRRLNQELGMTVIMSEHRLDQVLPIADRVVLMNDGSLVFDGEPKAAAAYMWLEAPESFQTYLPSAAKLYFSVAKDKIDTAGIPLSVKDGRAWFDARAGSLARADQAGPTMDPPPSPVQKPMLQFSDVVYRYTADEPFVLNRLSLEVREHEWLTLLGGNGSGKSTLLNVAAGLLKPQKGRVYLNGRKLRNIADKQLYCTIGLLPQNPMAYFICDTLKEELILAAQRLDIVAADRDMERMIDIFKLEPLLDRHPHDLSGGERQKAALACILMGRPRLLLIDEPTKGLDPQTKAQLAAQLRLLHQDGLTILMVTHDVEFAALTATRCALLFDGEIASDGSPQTFFSHNYFYTTSVNRIVRDYFPQMLVEEEVPRIWEALIERESCPL